MLAVPKSMRKPTSDPLPASIFCIPMRDLVLIKIGAEILAYIFAKGEVPSLCVAARFLDNVTSTRISVESSIFSSKTSLSVSQPHEANHLKLDSSKVHNQLNWHPRWHLQTALQQTPEWHQAWRNGDDMRAITLAQVAKYEQRPW